MSEEEAVGEVTTLGKSRDSKQYSKRPVIHTTFLNYFQMSTRKKSKSGKTSINKLESWVNQLQLKKRDFKHNHIQSAKNQ